MKMSTSTPTHWQLPRRQLLRLACSLPGGQPRSLRADVAAVVAKLPEQPHIRGLGYVPPTGPVVLAANHYEAPGLWIGWAGSVITWATGQVRGDDPPVHWLVVGDERRGRATPVPLSRWLFERIAHMWGMVPLARDGDAVVQRALALRHLSRLLATDQVVGIFPEGAAGRAGPPGPALPGAAGWLRRQVRHSVPVIPVAVRAAGPTLAISFGAPLAADDDVMSRIAELYAGLGTAPE